MHFNKKYDEEFFKQLTSEKVVNTYIKGVAVRKWVKTRARNEALDINVYHLAALSILNPNFKKIKENLTIEKKEIVQKTRTLKRQNSKGGWVNGWSK